MIQLSDHSRRCLHSSSSSLAESSFNEKTKDLSEVQAAEVAGDQRAKAKLVDSVLTASWYHHNKSSTSNVIMLHNMAVLSLPIFRPCCDSSIFDDVCITNYLCMLLLLLIFFKYHG